MGLTASLDMGSEKMVMVYNVFFSMIIYLPIKYLLHKCLPESSDTPFLWFLHLHPASMLLYDSTFLQ